jgi:hypothetical protein
MKGFIYVIKSKQTTDVYYGSTKKKLNIRLNEHKSGYRGHLKGKYPYTTSYEIIQYDDAFIELVEIVEYEDKEELKKREGYYIQNNECVNKHIAGLTRKETSKEYREKNREYILLERKEYREKNRDKIREYDRLRRLKKKEELI